MNECIHYGSWLLLLASLGKRQPLWLKVILLIDGGYLALAFLSTDFSLQLITACTIWTPFFKLASLWTSHEGSIFLAVFCLSLILTKDLIKWTPFFLSGLYLFLTANPFLKRGEIILDFLPQLTLLQDPLLLIHPPITY